MYYHSTEDYDLNKGDDFYQKVDVHFGIDKSSDDDDKTPVPPDEGEERGARTYITCIPQHTR